MKNGFLWADVRLEDHDASQQITSLLFILKK